MGISWTQKRGFDMQNIAVIADKFLFYYFCETEAEMSVVPLFTTFLACILVLIYSYEISNIPPHNEKRIVSLIEI